MAGSWPVQTVIACVKEDMQPKHSKLHVEGLLLFGLTHAPEDYKITERRIKAFISIAFG